MSDFIARWHTSITEINATKWDQLSEQKLIPFFTWRWLNALESSESVCQKRGWQPIHLSLWRKSSLIAIAPLYLKNHSYGEFIFDQIFAELATQLGQNYYPKLIGMSPFSPVEGYQFLIAPNENKQAITNAIMHEIDRFALKNQILSCNFLYVDSIWQTIAEKAGCATWLNKQSRWTSCGETNFSDYLANFNSNQRRNIKRERKSVKDAGLSISVITGQNINQRTIENMYELYEKHCSKWGVWGSKYLSKKFFETIFSSLDQNQMVFFNANRGDTNKPVAMSFCITNGDILWGRYWGSHEEIDCLHFENCYYSPIDWAINKGIKFFDPGAGGSHKRRRGFLAKPNTSLHRWYNPTMDHLIRNWLTKVNKLMIHEIKAENNEVPYKVDLPPLSIPE